MARVALTALLGCGAGACDVEWGGARVALEDPAPPDTVVAETEMPRPVTPLPGGPLLYHLRAVEEGRVLATPVAEWAPESGPDTLAWPPAPDPEWRARFDSTFLARGTELAVLSAAVRLGSVVLGGDAAAASGPDCPSSASGRWLLLPGVTPPDEAWAVPLGAVVALPAPPPAVELADRIRTFGPILAENLLRAAGESRPWLAQRADIRALPFEEDEAPAMAATYLIGDQLGAPPPEGEAVSLFYLARYAPARGYYPVWREVRRYGGGEREAFAWRDALPLAGGGRVEILTRYGPGRTRLAAGIAGDGETEAIGITWVQSSCRVLGVAEGDAGVASTGPTGRADTARREAEERQADAAADAGTEILPPAAPAGAGTADTGALAPVADTGTAVAETAAAGPEEP